MRIALVAEHYPPTEGGVATSAQRVARSLAGHGLDVEVFCFDDTRAVTTPTYVISESDEQVTVRRVGPFFLKQPREILAQLDEKVKAAMRRQVVDKMIEQLAPAPPDVILSFYVLNAGFLAQFVGAALGVPVVVGVRGNDIGRNIFHVDRFAVTDWVIRRATAVACVNTHLRDRLLWTWPEAAAKVHVVPNSVPMPARNRSPADGGGGPFDRRAAELRCDLGWPDSAFVLIFIGTLREKKGVAVLISALTMLSDRDVRLLVVGPELGALERKLCGAEWDELRRAGRLHVTGLVPRERVARWMACANAVVMPSLDDGLANGLLEGMAHGLCPVASDIFGDVVADGIDGVLVPHGSIEALAAGIRKLVGDPAAARDMGRRAMDRVSRWTPAMEGNAYVELLRSVRIARVSHAQ